MTLASKRFGAQRTQVQSLTCVYEHVHGEVAFHCEPLRADLALVRSLTRMIQQMSCEIFFPHELLQTNFTLEGLLIPVAGHVSRQVANLGKFFCTNVTLV